MEIEIWSDVLCPFCYIGKRKFETALQQFAHQGEVRVVWKSFQLDPEMQASYGREYATYLQERKGWSQTQVKDILAQVTATAKKVGLDFHFEQAVVANSYHAHRVLHLAKEAGKQNDMKEALLKAHFTEGKNIEDKSTLLHIATEVGLDKVAVEKLLESQMFDEEVGKDIYEASQIGVRGVPFFVFDRKYAISGAQESDVFLKALESSFAESIATGQTCDIDGNC